MPTRMLDEDEGNSDTDTGRVSSPSNKKQKMTQKNSHKNLDFSYVLLECGVASIAGDNPKDTTSGTGCVLEKDATPPSVRASLHCLLAEMHKSGTDVDNTLVLESMEELISSGTLSNALTGKTSDDDDDKEDEIKNLVSFKLLLPMTCKSDREENDMNIEANVNEQTSQLSQDLLKDQPDTETPTKKNFDASLMKILLRVDALQPTLLTCLLGKLQEIATEPNEGMDDISTPSLDKYSCNAEIPRLILSHIRWLGTIVDPIKLIHASLECLTVLSSNLEDQDEVPPEGENITRTILLDLISTLPDIIDDSSIVNDTELMESVVSTLRDIRVQDSRMLIPCLDAVSALQLESQHVESIIQDALESMESSTESWLLPALSKFLVQNIPRRNNELCAKAIETFRRIRLGLDAEDFEGENATDMLDRGRNQMHAKTDSEALMLESLAQGFTYRVDLTNELIKAMSKSQHGAADVWLLMCCGVAAHNKTKVHQLVKVKAISGCFNRALLVDSIKGNGAALNHLFDTSALPLADFLVRSNEKVVRVLGGELYEELFFEFDDRIQRQEIVGQLVIHIASGLSYDEIDVAMKVFSNIVTKSSVGAQSLQVYLPFLMSLLDNVQNFEPPHLRRLFLILFSIGDSSSHDDVMNGGMDEVQILINKFLAMPNIAKQIGIIGVVAYASCLDEEGSPQKIKDVIQMLELVPKSCSGQITQQKAHGWSALNVNHSFMSIFFDELCLAMRACSLPSCVKAWILNCFSGALEDEFLGDLENAETYLSSDSKPQGDCTVVKDEGDKAIVDGTSQNVRAPKGELRYNIDREDAVVYLKVLSLHTSHDAFTREILTQQLCPLLRLLTVAYDERYGGDGIRNIDALLGCPLLLPDSTSSGIDFSHLSEKKKITTASSLFTAVSWCREIINSFIYIAVFAPVDSIDSQFTQEQDCTRQKVVEKLKCLLDLEEDLRLCSKKCYSFAPPGLLVLPVPKDIINCGNISETDDTNSNCPQDENGPGRMTSEEKKVLNALKKAAKKRMKSKQKILKTRAKHENILESRTYAALRPLSAYAALALGFPELRVAGPDASTSQEVMLSMGASELKHMKVGDRTTNTLLKLLNRSLKFSNNFVQTSLTSHFEGLNENPYDMRGLHKDGSKRLTSEFEFIHLCIDGNVFLSIHERLVAAAEILGSNEIDDLQTKEDTLECTWLLLQCITTLIEFKDPLFREIYFQPIIKQFADGESMSSKTLKSASTRGRSTFVHSAAALFDLLEEAVTGRETDDLAFSMVGVGCVDALVKRTNGIQSEYKNNAKERQLLEMNTKLSKLCLCLLRRDWNDEKLNKNNVGKLVGLYLEHSISDVQDVTSTQFEATKWGRLNAIRVLIDEAMMKLPLTPECKGPVCDFATCSRSTFSYFLSSTLTVITTECARLFCAYKKVDDAAPACLNVFRNLIEMMIQIFELSKNNVALAKNSLLLTQLKNGTKFISVVLKSAIPFFAKHFKAHRDAIIELLEMTQKITRQMNFILVFGKRTKDANLLREAPKVRKCLEEFIYKVKGLLKKGGVISALWGGTLKNRNIDGSKIDETSESDSEEEESERDESSGTESEEEDEFSS